MTMRVKNDEAFERFAGVCQTVIIALIIMCTLHLYSVAEWPVYQDTIYSDALCKWAPLNMNNLSSWAPLNTDH